MPYLKCLEMHLSYSVAHRVNHGLNDPFELQQRYPRGGPLSSARVTRMMEHVPTHLGESCQKSNPCDPLLTHWGNRQFPFNRKVMKTHTRVNNKVSY